MSRTPVLMTSLALADMAFGQTHPPLAFVLSIQLVIPTTRDPKVNKAKFLPSGTYIPECLEGTEN